MSLTVSVRQKVQISTFLVVHRVLRGDLKLETFRDQLIKLLIPLGKLLARTNIHPNVLSFSGIFFGIASAYFFAIHALLPAVLLFILSAVSDGVDGIVARQRGIASAFGSFFDNFCSAYTDSAVLVGLFIGQLAEPIWCFLALIGTMARLLTFRLVDETAPEVGEVLRTRFPYALAGKGDRIVLIAMGAVLGYINEAMIVIAVSANLIAILRAHYLYSSTKAVTNKPHS